MLPAPSMIGSKRRHGWVAGATKSSAGIEMVALMASVSLIGYCPARHGNAARSAHRTASVSTTAIIMMVRMQANMRSSA